MLSRIPLPTVYLFPTLLALALLAGAWSAAVHAAAHEDEPGHAATCELCLLSASLDTAPMPSAVSVPHPLQNRPAPIPAGAAVCRRCVPAPFPRGPPRPRV